MNNKAKLSRVFFAVATLGSLFLGTGCKQTETRKEIICPEGTVPVYRSDFNEEANTIENSMARQRRTCETENSSFVWHSQTKVHTYIVDYGG